MVKNLKFVFVRIENIVGKEENAVFSPFLTMFSKDCFRRVVKGWGLCGKELNQTVKKETYA